MRAESEAIAIRRNNPAPVEDAPVGLESGPDQADCDCASADIQEKPPRAYGKYAPAEGDLRALEDEYDCYLRKECPNLDEIRIFWRVSDAFYALRNDVGVGFWEMLSSRERHSAGCDAIRSSLRENGQVDDSRYTDALSSFKLFLDSEHPLLALKWSGHQPNAVDSEANPQQEETTDRTCETTSPTPSVATEPESESIEKPSLRTDEKADANRVCSGEAPANAMVREKYAYVRRDYVRFDIRATDEAIGRYVPKDHLPLKAFTAFSDLPPCGCDWNIYLLGNYCSRFSEEFRLKTLARESDNGSVGAIVRKEAQGGYMDIMATAVTDAEVRLAEGPVVDFLVKSGYVVGLTFREADTIVDLAKALVPESPDPPPAAVSDTEESAHETPADLPVTASSVVSEEEERPYENTEADQPLALTAVSEEEKPLSESGLKALKEEYEAYLRTSYRLFDRNTISIYAKHAFYASNNDVGMGFWEMLSSYDSICAGNEKIKIHLRSKGNFASSSGYIDALMRFKRFLDEKHPGLALAQSRLQPVAPVPPLRPPVIPPVQTCETEHGRGPMAKGAPPATFDGLKEEFREYLRDTFPNRSTEAIDSKVSAIQFAFDNRMGMDFWSVFEDTHSVQSGMKLMREYREKHGYESDSQYAKQYANVLWDFGRFLRKRRPGLIENGPILYPQPYHSAPYSESRVETWSCDERKAVSPCGMKSETQSEERASPPVIHKYDSGMADKISSVLSSRFSNGCRLSSSIELMRFRSFALEDEGIDTGSIGDDELREIIRSCGRLHDGKIYPLSGKPDEKIKELADEYFDEGARAIFYSEFYRKNYSWLLESGVVSEDMLIKILRDAFPCGFAFKEKFFQKTGSSRDLLEDEILHVWSDDDLSLTCNQIAERLRYIPFEVIESVLKDKKNDFINNGKDSFTHLGQINFPEGDEDKICEIAAKRCASKGFVSMPDLMMQMETEGIEYESLNPGLSNVALQVALYRLCLEEEFDWRGNSLFPKSIESANTKSLMKEWCSSQDRCTLEDISEYMKEIGIKLYPSHMLSAACNTMVRIDRDTFMADKYVAFDVDETDEIIGRYLRRNNYVPLKSFTNFSVFPSCGHRWNLFILESYCRRFSPSFRFDVASANSSNAGAVVRKGCELSYTGIMIDAVAKAGIPLDADPVSRFLIDQGYVCSGVGEAKMSEIIKRAKAARAKGV